MIESVNNERVKHWTKLNDKKYQREEGLFLVEGEHLVIEAEKAGLLKEVIVLEGNDFEYVNRTVVSENVMKKITSLKSPPRIVGVVEILKSREISGSVVLLDAVSDPGNLGTIIRSCVAFGVDTLVLGTGCVGLYNPKVVRASEGLLFHVNIVERPLEEAIPTLQERGYKIYATDVRRGTTLKNTTFSSRTAVVMGNEGAGVREEIKAICDEYLYIEMSSQCESLNVGVATSIILYELYTNLNIQ